MLNHLIPESGTNAAVSKPDEHISCEYFPHWKDDIGVIRHSGLSKQVRPICVSVIYIKGNNKTLHICLWFFFFNFIKGPGWPNELGSWITQQLIQAYHQYGVGSRPA
jgi:hypothetical protein